MRIALNPNQEFLPPQDVTFAVFGKADILLLEKHLTALDPQARHDRFNAGESTEMIAEYARKCFQPDVLVIAAEYQSAVVGIRELHPAQYGAA
jgi:hypothetical protein